MVGNRTSRRICRCCFFCFSSQRKPYFGNLRTAQQFKNWFFRGNQVKLIPNGRDAGFLRCQGLQLDLAGSISGAKLLPSPRLTWKLPGPLWKTGFHLQRSSGSFHVSLRECTSCKAVQSQPAAGAPKPAMLCPWRICHWPLACVPRG